jgi:hypothetical protein
LLILLLNTYIWLLLVLLNHTNIWHNLSLIRVNLSWACTWSISLRHCTLELLRNIPRVIFHSSHHHPHMLLRQCLLHLLGILHKVLITLSREPASNHSSRHGLRKWVFCLEIVFIRISCHHILSFSILVLILFFDINRFFIILIVDLFILVLFLEHLLPYLFLLLLFIFLLLGDIYGIIVFFN